MENSTLVKILKTLNKKEVRQFQKFIVSPYFNSSEATIKLYKEINKFYPEFSGKNFNRDYLFGRVYRKKKYNDVLFRKLVSNLIKLSKEFLFMTGVSANRFKSNIYYFIELSERGLNDIYEADYKKCMDDLKSLPIIESDYFSIYTEHYLVKSLHQNINSELKKCYESMIIASGYMVLDFYTHYCSINGISQVVSKLVNVDFGESPLLNLGETVVKKGIPGKLKEYFTEHKNIIELFEMYSGKPGETNIEFITKMKKRFYENYSRFTRTQKRNFIYQLLEHIRGLQNVSQKEKHKIELEFYVLMLSEELYNRKPGLPMQSTTFGNILRCYLGLDMPDKAAEFIELYKTRLQEEYRVSAYYYARAKIYFHEKKYEKSIQAVSKVDLKQMPFCYLARVLMISSCIELNDAERALYSADTFAHFLKTNPIVSDYNRNRFKKFLKYSAKIAKCLSGNERENLEEEYLKLKKADEKDYFGYEWLIGKTEELIKVNKMKIPSC